MQQELAERGKSGEDRQALLDDLLEIVTDPAVADEEIGALIRGEKIGWEQRSEQQVSRWPAHFCENRR
ncbi:hypothetical protein OH799_18490 [Nocardia sp. NBC_00881]|nr:hypothetical protein OH799_18490 [Nocardia sp. NBC_00881]